MCGFAGILERGGGADGSLEREAGRMAATLAHRGPDDEGIWSDAACGIALAHRRLSILDLSPAGHQPMQSSSGRYIIVYNGEIYNCGELRRQLQQLGPGLRLRGHSDTEIMLASFERWGVRGALERFRGMFAFALWDREARELHLARDRFGEKPLYYGWQGGALLFGSELKALCASPRCPREIDRQALAAFFRANCIPAPKTIYKGIRKLPPATCITLSARAQSAEPVSYWSLLEVAQQAAAFPFAGGEVAARERVEALLDESVRQRMIADVPLGAFLSGGIDSSLTVALMQRHASIPVQTFSIGLHDTGYNEAENARVVAAHLGTQHTELIVEPQQALDVVPKLAAIYDEPFADSSQVPVYLLAQLTRRQVKVGLSGDGGDEVFGGYNRHAWVERLWRQVGWMPAPLRKTLGRCAMALPARQWNALAQALSPALPSAAEHRLPGDKLHKLAPLLGVKDARSLYRGLASHWGPEQQLVLGQTDDGVPLNGAAHFRSFTAEMIYYDTITYLPDDVLTKVDRASMAHGLEVRTPFLDHPLVEFAWQLPLNMKVRGRQGKWVLRELLATQVPRPLWERPKMGFGIPLDQWLRGPLREWAEELLSLERLKRDQFLNVTAVREKWEEHLSGLRDWQYHIWDVLMFESWLEASREPAATHAGADA